MIYLDLGNTFKLCEICENNYKNWFAKQKKNMKNKYITTKRKKFPIKKNQKIGKTIKN